MVVSPYSLYSVLFLLWLGGKGKTSEDIAKVMKLKPDTPKQTPLQMLVDPAFSTASKIFIAEGTNVTNTFQGFTDSVDFTQSASIEKINRWIRTATNGKLAQFLDAQDVNPDTLMLLLNVLYFKGLWDRPFDTVHAGKFRNEDGKQVDATFMSDIVSLLFF